MEDIPDLQELPPEKAQQKLFRIKEGAMAKAQYPPFPPTREAQDVGWLIAFVIMTVVVWGGGLLKCHSLMSLFDEMSDEADKEAATSDFSLNNTGGNTMGGMQFLNLTFIAGGVSLFSAMSFLFLAASPS